MSKNISDKGIKTQAIHAGEDMHTGSHSSYALGESDDRPAGT
jgi:hypothetical protein